MATRNRKEPAEPRYDSVGRLMCSARRRGTDELCKAPAMTGQRVCRNHGGSSPQAKRAARLRLMELVDPAIATLAREMVQAEKSRDKQSAANSILDRAGYGRTTRVETADARQILYERLLTMQRELTETEKDDDASD